jgi:hypothetical protein
MRIRYSLVVALASLLVLAGGASADTGFIAHLDGLQEVGPNASPGTGTCFAVLNNAGTLLTYSVSYSGLTAPRTASHFHATGCPGINASVQLPIAGSGPTADSFSGAGAVNATLLAALLNTCAGGSVPVYVNIHTSNFPGGEIRGQLFPDVTPSRKVSWGKIKMLYR